MIHSFPSGIKDGQQTGPAEHPPHALFVKPCCEVVQNEVRHCWQTLREKALHTSLKNYNTSASMVSPNHREHWCSHLSSQMVALQLLLITAWMVLAVFSSVTWRLCFYKNKAERGSHLTAEQVFAVCLFNTSLCQKHKTETPLQLTQGIPSLRWRQPKVSGLAERCINSVLLLAAALNCIYGSLWVSQHCMDTV